MESINKTILLLKSRLEQEKRVIKALEQSIESLEQLAEMTVLPKESSIINPKSERIKKLPKRKSKRGLGSKSSKYKGVNYHKKSKKWRAYYCLGKNKIKHLGCFDTELEAHNAREGYIEGIKDISEQKSTPASLQKYSKKKLYRCRSCDHKFKDKNPKMCPLCQSSLIERLE